MIRIAATDEFVCREIATYMDYNYMHKCIHVQLSGAGPLLYNLQSKSDKFKSWIRSSVRHVAVVLFFFFFCNYCCPFLFLYFFF